MDNCMKSKDKCVSDHQDIMEEIMRYSRYLEGARANLSDSEIKTIIFTSFPVTWRIRYKQSQPLIQGSSKKAIMIFMSQEKELLDQNNSYTSC